MRFVLAVLLVLASLGFVRAAQAHSTPTSSLVLDIGSTVVEADLDLAVDQLALAYGAPIDANAPVDPALVVWLRPYLRLHVSLAAKDSAVPFDARLVSATMARNDDGPKLRVHLRFDAPEGTGTRDLVLFDDAILEHVVTHRTVVSVRRDFERGQLEPTPAVVGITLFSQKIVAIDRNDASPLRGFGATVVLGARHIAEGKDHLLFVLMLLIAAPLVAVGKSWVGVRSTKDSLRAVVAVVSAFTLGHSLSLAACVLGFVHPPARVVETLVAASILVGAVHAIRPVVPRHEAAIAGAFGLVHGMAFGGTLVAFGFSGSTLAIALLGFNVGIELAQLAAIGIAMPWILLLVRTPFANAARVAIASFGVVASLGWITARAFDRENVVSVATDAILSHAAIGVVALAVVALFLRRYSAEDWASARFFIFRSTMRFFNAPR